MTCGLRLMIVGAPKSGSTAMFSYLSQHPLVRSHVHREMPFFGRDDEFEQGWAGALGKYFPRETDPAAPLVAKHTMSMYDAAALRRIERSTSAVAVAVLRDPVRRAYSHYRYARLRGWEDAPTFEEALEREAHRPVSSPRRARDLQYVGDGLYAGPVADLLETFPPERRRVYLSDDLQDDPRRVCDELFHLAGLPSHQPDLAQRHNETRRPRSARLARAFLAIQQPGNPLRKVASRYVHSATLYRARSLVNRLNEAGAPVEAMREETAHRLSERFRAPNAALAELLDRSLVAWAR